MNILEQFYILFKSDADQARKDTDALKHSSEGAAAANDAAALSVEALRKAQTIAAAQAAVASRAALEFGTEEAIAAAKTAKETLALAAARVKEAEATEAAAIAEGELAGAYAFSRSQRMELMGLARHSIDQLAAGGSVMRVAQMHAATLAEALSNGPGGLAAGFGALAGAAGKFVKAWGLPLAVIGSVIAAVGIAKGSVKDLEAMRINADRAGLKVEDYDAIRKVVRNLGGDVKEVDHDLERFATRIDDAFGSLSAKKPDAVAKAFHSVGISIKDANGHAKDTKTALLDLAGAFEHVSAEKQAAALKAMGFETPRHGKTDEGVLKLLTGGRAAMEQYIEAEKRLGGVTEKQIEVAHRYKLETERLGDRFRDLRNTIAQFVLPILTDLVDGMRACIEWVRLNSTLVTGFGVAFVAAAVVVAAATWGTLVPAFAAAAVAVLAATWPIILIGAAVAATAAIFAACYEDVMFFLKGQPSLLGELVNKYAWVKNAVHAVGATFKELALVGKETWRLLVAGATAAGAWITSTFGKVAPAVMHYFRSLWAILGPIVRLIADVFGPLVMWVAKATAAGLALVAKDVWSLIVTIAKFFGGLAAGITHVFLEVVRLIAPAWFKFMDGLADRVGGIVKGIREALHLKPDASLAGVGPARSALNFAASVPFAAVSPAAVQMGGVRPNKTQTIQIGKVDVNTQATDAKGIADAFSDHLTTELRRATQNFDDGVDR